MLTLPGEIASSLADESSRPQLLLGLENVTAGYGGPPVISSLSLRVGQGEVVTVVGPNGAGKSTVVKAVIGEIPITDGRVTLAGEEITNLPTEMLVRHSVGYVPQVRDVFPTMSVRENLEMGGYLLPKKEVDARIEEVFEIFPQLKALAGRRSAVSKLSGGERKMVALGRALMFRPKLLILDEPTAGLAVQIARRVLREQISVLVERGTAVLLIEQRATDALEISDWGYVLVSGQVKISAQASTILARKDIGEIFLGKSITAAG